MQAIRLKPSRLDLYKAVYNCITDIQSKKSTSTNNTQINL